MHGRALFVLFVQVALVAAGALSSAARQSDDTELIERIRQQLKIPSTYEVKLGPAEKSNIAGLIKRKLDVSGGPKPRTQTIFLSEDGRYLFWGRLYDLQAQPSAERFENISVDGHPTRGPADAEIIIVEFSDFQCPFCERAYWTVKYKLLRRYAGQVRLVYKDFPLTKIHPWALKAAIGAQCAFEQRNEAFWKMHDLIFENQDEITPDNVTPKLTEFAVTAGLNQPAFEKCYETEATLARVKASLAEAESLGLTGTPAFIVNGQLLSGAVPFPAFKTLIEKELAAQPADASAPPR